MTAWPSSCTPSASKGSTTRLWIDTLEGSQARPAETRPQAPIFAPGFLDNSRARYRGLTGDVAAEEVLDFTLWLCSDRECDGDASSTFRRAVDLEGSAERLDSVLQPDEP